MRKIAFVILFILAIGAVLAGPLQTQRHRDADTEALQSLFFYNSDGYVEYECKADIGRTSGESYWNIRKFTYNADGNLTKIQFADNSLGFNRECDEREGYDYD